MLTNIPALPPNLEQPCEPLREFTKTDAVSNFLWISETISKYNRCSIAKDAVTEAYQTIYKETNNEKP